MKAPTLSNEMLDRMQSAAEALPEPNRTEARLRLAEARPLLVDLAVGDALHRRVRVHGAGGVLLDTAHNVGRLRAWLAEPQRWPRLRIYTRYSARDEVSIEVSTADVRLIAVHRSAGAS